MLFGTRVPRRLSFLVIALSVALMQRASADSTAQTLPFSQDWNNAALITANDNWSGVPGIEGFHGVGLVLTTGIASQTVLAPEAMPVTRVRACVPAPPPACPPRPRT